MRGPAIMAATGALAAAGSALAQAPPPPSSLALFRAICVDTDGRPASALLADSHWTELNPQMAVRFEPLRDLFHNALIRAEPLGTGIVVAFSGTDGVLPGVEFATKNVGCAVMSINTGADETNVLARTNAWLGAAAPPATLGPANIYTYTEKAGVRTVLTAADDAGRKKAIANAALHLVFVRSEGGQTFFAYLIQTPVN
jgi:hypothetical protein